MPLNRIGSYLKPLAVIAGALSIPQIVADTEVAVAAASGPELPPPPANGELAFVVNTFAPAILPGTDNCPAALVNTNKENYLEMLPAAERARLVKPENEVELTTRWQAASLGPNNTNLCTNYDLFPDRPLHKLLQGKVSYGVDLDNGGAKANDGYTCGHDEFVDPAGRPGIDNQAYRVFGCTRSWRGLKGEPGETVQYFKNAMHTGEWPIVLRIRGVDSLQNDDAVEVTLASSPDAPLIDAQGAIMAGGTFRITPNPRWRNVLRGQIRNGVLTTTSKQIVLSHVIMAGPRARRQEWDFDRGQLQLAFQADGSLSGVLGGYQPFFSLIHGQVNAGLGSAYTVNLDCASDYNTMVKLADGARDPKTGKCTRISSAWQVSATPAAAILPASGRPSS